MMDKPATGHDNVDDKVVVRMEVLVLGLVCQGAADVCICIRVPVPSFFSHNNISHSHPWPVILKTPSLTMKGSVHHHLRNIIY
jgi:hypothetical protein